MISRNGLRHLRPSFAQRFQNAHCLPGPVSLQQRSSQRAFHPSRPNQIVSELLEPLSYAVEPISQGVEWGLQGVHACLQFLHTQAGLSWACTIPLAAVLIRASWIPVQFLAARMRQRRRVAARLKEAWLRAYNETAIIKFAGRRQVAVQAKQWRNQALEHRAQMIRKRVPHWPFAAQLCLNLSFIPVWLISADCIRLMAGNARTWSSILFGDSSDHVASVVIPVEHDLAVESLGWIPDLAHGDPYCVLPVAYMAIATYSVWNRVKLLATGEFSTNLRLRTQQKFWQAVGRILLLTPTAFAIVMIQTDMATAVVLYFLTNSLTVVATKPILERIGAFATPMPTLIPRLPMAKRGLVKRRDRT
jgi:membrane protein insertase Oxa1/YidC/SpoIIIJ